MKYETTKVKTVTLTDAEVRIAIWQYAGLPAGSQVKLVARTDGEVVSASVSRTVTLNDNEDFSEAIYQAVTATNDLMTEAQVDYPAGCDAGPSITFDEDGMRKIFSDLIAKAKEIGA